MKTAFLAPLARRFWCNENGNIAIIAGLLMVPMMVATGGVVDMVYAVNKQNTLQQAADAAALAASRAEVGERQSVAETTFDANLQDRISDAELDVASNGDGSVTVTATLTYQTAFVSLVGISSWPIVVASTAITDMTEDTEVTTTTTQTVSSYATACMLAKASSGGNALLVNSPANVDGADCEVHVRSSSNDAFMFNSGTVFDAARFCIKGTATVRGTTDGQIVTGCNAATDTIAGTLPVPSVSACTFNNYTPNSTTSLVLTPGTYCGWSNFNGKPKITLTPGLYVIKDGGWNLNDGVEVTGTGVTIYLTGSSAAINMNGKMSWDISAPTSGTYKGILYFQNPSLSANNFIFNGLNGQHLEGLIYLPTQNIQFKSTSKIGTRDAISVVANTIIIDGEATWRFGPATDWTVPGSETTSTQTVTTTETVPGEIGSSRLLR